MDLARSSLGKHRHGLVRRSLSLVISSDLLATHVAYGCHPRAINLAAVANHDQLIYWHCLCGGGLATCFIYPFCASLYGRHRLLDRKHAHARACSRISAAVGSHGFWIRRQRVALGACESISATSSRSHADRAYFRLPNSYSIALRLWSRRRHDCERHLCLPANGSEHCAGTTTGSRRNR